MVSEQLARRGLHEPRLLAAFERVPRHLFVPGEYIDAAYTDGALPIGGGQTISQPYIVALMTDFLQLKGTEAVLEVGTGSGYQAAILSCLAQSVHTVERVPELAARARALLGSYKNVQCHEGDGSLGWPAAAPYQGILVTAAAPKAPRGLLEQLSEGGRLVLPVGGPGYQVLEVWTRRGDDFSKRDEIGVAFVLLRGEHGW